MTKAKNTSGSGEDKSREMIIKVLIGSAVGSVLFFLLLLLSAAALLKLDIGTQALTAVTVASAAIAALMGGFVAVRPIRKNGAFLGAMSALPAIAGVIIAVLISADAPPGKNMLAAAAVMLVFGALGGIAATNMRKKSKESRARKR